MDNQINELREILLSVVNDLEKTAAELTVSTTRLQKIAPISTVDQKDALRLAAKANEGFYAGLREKIESLPKGDAR